MPYIERKFGSCANDGQSVADLCWGGDHLSILLNGHSSDLVRDTTVTGSVVYRLKDDPGWRVEKITGIANGDNDGETFTVRTPDGSTYYFGRSTASSAVYTVPVFGDDAGEPCHQSTFALSWCNQAWRWNLDTTVDRNGIQTRYFYGRETNEYRMRGVTNASYVRGGYLYYVDYSMDGAGQAQASVAFTVRPRCLLEADGSSSLTVRGCHSALPAYASEYPDVPVDLYCATACTEPSPSFYTAYLVRAATARRWSGTTWVDVDRTLFGYTFPTTNDGTDPSLWLAKADRTGLAGGSSASVPSVEFGGVAMANRVDDNAALGVALLKKYRVTSIKDELGAQTVVTYGHGAGGGCVKTALPSDWSANSKECFPRYWVPDAGPAGFGIFHKYVTTRVRRVNAYAGDTGADQTTAYYYEGNAAWHYDDNPVAPVSVQSWAGWRGYGVVKVRALSDPNYRDETSERALSLSRYTYYRGMHQDRTSGGGSKTVTFTDSTGATLTDWAYAEGMTREEQTFEVGGGGGDLGEQSGELHSYVSARTVRDNPAVSDPQHDAYLMYESSRISRQTTKPDTGTTLGTRSVTQTWTKDSYGRTLTAQSSGAGSGDTRCTSYEYTADPATLDANRLDFPAVVRNSAGTCAAPTETLAEQRIFYDGSTTLADAVGAGNPTSTWRARDVYHSFLIHHWVTNTATFDTYGRVLTAVDGRGKTSTTTYTPTTGIPATVTVTNPLGQTTSTSLEPDRMAPTTITDANGAVTTCAYDALGRATSVWLPGQVTTGPASVKFSYLLDANRINPPVTTASNLQPDGSYLTSATVMDRLGNARQTQTDSPASTAGTKYAIVANTRYDDRGLPTGTTTVPAVVTGVPGSGLMAVTSSNTAETTTAYDSLGRPTTASLKYNGTFRWSSTTAYYGDHVRNTPPSGGVTTTAWTDVLGRTTRRDEGTGSNLVSTSYAFDRADRLFTITDGSGHITTNEYDPLGRRTSTTDPDTGTSTMNYDDNSNITSSSSAGRPSISTVYDDLNRPIATWLGNPGVGTQLGATTYDTATNGTGRVATTTTYSGAATYTQTVAGYTPRGLPTGMTYGFPALGGKATPTTLGVTTGYDTVGRPTTLTYNEATPGGPVETLTTGFDSHGAPATLTSDVAGAPAYVAATGYYSNGTLASRILGAGTGTVRRDYGWETDTGRLSHVTTTTGPSTMVQDDAYGWNPAGDLTLVTDQVPATEVRTCHGYDSLDRLTHSYTTTAATCDHNDVTTAAGVAGYNKSWTFTTDGNIATTRDGATNRAYTYTDTAHPHAATAAGTNSYGYGADGSMTARTTPAGASTLTWDPLGHLASATTAGASTSFVHAPDGTRLARTTPDGTATIYLAGEEVDITAGALSATRRYYALAGDTIGVRTAAGLTWQGNDRQNSTDLQVTDTTSATSRAYYDPFGKTRTTTPPVLLVGDRGFLNKTTDPSTGLSQLGARYYDTDLARFISPDALNDQSTTQTPNPYTYAANNPIGYSDPTGFSSCADSCQKGDQWIASNGGPIHKPGAPYVGGQPPKPTPPKPTPPGPKPDTSTGDGGDDPWFVDAVSAVTNFQTGVWRGQVQSVRDNAVGLYELGKCGNAIALMAGACTMLPNVITTLRDDGPGALWDGLKDPFVSRYESGDIAGLYGYASSEAVLALAGTKGVTKVTAGGRAAAETEASALRHYTTSEAAEAITKGGSINPGASGKTWLTHDNYATGADARAKLALNKTPDGYFEIPACRVSCPSPPSRVEPYHGQPGGGTEITTRSPIDVSGLMFRKFG